MFRYSLMMLLMTFTVTSQGGVRSGDSGGGSGQMVMRLQNMVRQATKERDAMKTENAKLQSELTALKKDLAKMEDENASVSSKLTGERSSHNQLKVRQQQTYDKLVEVVEKYKALNQVKNQLMVDLKQSRTQHQQTGEQLEICSQHNGKLISAAYELLERYQNKGRLSALLRSEPLLQFNSVEMENIVQEYEDRIRDEKYQQTVSLQE